MNKTLLKCKKCNTIFSIPFKNKKLKISCKKCDNVFIWEPTSLNDIKSSFYEGVLEGRQFLNKNDLSLASAGLGFLSQKKILEWLRDMTNKTPDGLYDKAMDAVYNDPSHHNYRIGGGNHRLFDGGHDPLGAWEAVRNASDTDSFAQEVIGYVCAMFKDMSTPNGMPFFTVDKDWYDNSSEWVASNIPGASKDWFRDLMTYDTMELFSTSLGVVGALFFLKKKDKEKLSEILGSMGIISIFGANPLMAISVMCMTAYSYYKTKNKLSAKSFSIGMSSATISWLVFSLLGLPIIIELVIAIVILKFVKKYNYSPKEIMDLIISKWNNLKPEDRKNIVLPVNN